MSLLYYEQAFSSLRMNSRDGSEKSPHKVAMLLAVIALIEEGGISENKIYFNNLLKDNFTKQFQALAGIGDRNNPHLPFFHLRSSKFWHHQIKAGNTANYNLLTTASSPKVVDDNISHVRLDDELFELLNNSYARGLLRQSLNQNLTQASRRELLNPGNGWDWLECEATVQDYFAMLEKELAGTKYNKAEHRRALSKKLHDRSEASIEFKHQNISAILLQLGQSYIKGYKPAVNYQGQLKEVVLAHLASNLTKLEYLNSKADVPIQNQSMSIDWENVMDDDRPELIPGISEPKREFLARSINYSKREQRNRSLGESGEEFVLDFERFRLTKAGKPDLAKEVEWSSKAIGDGLGYDIRSFDPIQEEELFIEVKTTKSGKYQPFFITDNELDFSREYSSKYSLYRVYEFDSNARFFQLQGAVEQYVNLQAKQYKASFS